MEFGHLSPSREKYSYPGAMVCEWPFFDLVPLVPLGHGRGLEWAPQGPMMTGLNSLSFAA